MTIASLIVDVAANTVKLQTDVNKIHGQLDSVSTMASRVGTALAGAFTVTAITGAVSQVINYADKISNLADQTGLTKRTLQEMDHVAKLAGTTLDSMTNAAFKLGTNLAGGGSSVVGAVEKLGLSWFQLKQQSPDQQFNTIMTALNGVQNAQERNKLAIELFGKAAKDILPAIAQGYDKLASSALVASDAQIDALDLAGDALDSFWSLAKSTGVYLAGGFVLAVREAALTFESWIPIVGTVSKGLEHWGTVLEFVGLKAQAMPKVMGEMKVQAAGLPQPLQAVSLSVTEQETRMRALETQHRAVAKSTASIGVAQEEVDPRIERLTRSFEQQIEALRRTNTLANTVWPSFRLVRDEMTALIPVVQSFTTTALEPLKAGLTDSKVNIDTWGKHFKATFEALPTVIMSAIQGGGSIIGAAGSHIGTSLMSKFQEKFGPAITAALPFGIGAAINSLLPTLGALFGPIAEKIGSFFRNIFGGPSAEELRGRQAVADFEAQLHALVSATDKASAGNESWRMTVIAIRDAYIAQGLTEAQALLAAERLWASSKKGAGEVQAAIDAIRAVLDGVKGSTDQVTDAINRIPRTVDIDVNENRTIHENVYRDFYDGESGDGFAGGTIAMGSWFRNFGGGRRVTLHGEEAVVRKDQAVPFADAVRGGDSGALVDEMRRLIRELPRAMKVAVGDAIVLQGARR